MTLLPNEAKIITSDDEKIILTNHRIQMTDSVWGQSFFICIFLEDISSITIKYKSNIIFIILTAVFHSFFSRGSSASGFCCLAIGCELTGEAVGQ